MPYLVKVSDTKFVNLSLAATVEILGDPVPGVVAVHFVGDPANTLFRGEEAQAIKEAAEWETKFSGIGDPFEGEEEDDGFPSDDDLLGLELDEEDEDDEAVDEP